jgi:hypothetical protein
MNRISVFDNIVPWHDMHHAFEYSAGSKFILGWADKMAIENEKYIENIHSTWVAGELNESRLMPYFNQCIEKTSWFPKVEPQKIIMNLVMTDDVHYLHSHQNQSVLLYYVNLEWQDGWHGETLFCDPNNLDEVVFTSLYKPGRILLFDGKIPHSIRPQSRKGPKYRMTLSLFFDDRTNGLS